MNLRYVSRLACGVLSLCSLTSCGGGGGGGSAPGAAFVNVDASPRSFDVGDVTTVSIDISEIHKDGISLKIKFPVELSYVNNSAVLFIGDDEVDLAPAVNANGGDDSYLVFYISKDSFEGDDDGTLVVELEGESDLEDALIEIDPDVDDPEIGNDVEFNIEEPEFSAEDEVHVFIQG